MSYGSHEAAPENRIDGAAKSLFTVDDDDRNAVDVTSRPFSVRCYVMFSKLKTQSRSFAFQKGLRLVAQRAVAARIQDHFDMPM